MCCFCDEFIDGIIRSKGEILKFNFIFLKREKLRICNKNFVFAQLEPLYMG
jgi:hypothetical protein